MKLKCPHCFNVTIIDDAEFEQYYKYAKTFLCEKCEGEFINPFAYDFDKPVPPQKTPAKKSIFIRIIDSLIDTIATVMQGIFCTKYKNKKAMFIGFLAVSSIIFSPAFVAGLTTIFHISTAIEITIVHIVNCLAVRVFAAAIEADFNTYLNIENEKLRILQLIQHKHK